MHKSAWDPGPEPSIIDGASGRDIIASKGPGIIEIININMPKQDDVAVVSEQSEVNRLMSLDTTPWYSKPNLRFLYFCLVPAALGVEMTTGYDGSVLNGLQAVTAWQDRESTQA